MSRLQSDSPATWSYTWPTGGVRYYFRTDTVAISTEAAATRNVLHRPAAAQGGFMETNGEPCKKPTTGPATPRVIERPRNPSSRMPDLREPLKSEAYKRKETDR